MKFNSQPSLFLVTGLLIAVLTLGCDSTETNNERVKPSQKTDSGSYNFPDATNGNGWPPQDASTISNDATQQPDSQGWDMSQPSDNGSSSTDAGPGQDTSQGIDIASADTGPKAPVSGGVLIVEVDSQQYELGTAAAHLVYGALPEATPITTYGLCDVLPAEELTPPKNGLDAGVISLEGLLKPVTLTPTQAPEGIIYSSNLPESTKNILLGNSPVTAKAAGGAHMPAWSLTVEQPKPITILSPKTGVLDNLSSSQALTIQWNPANGTSSTVHLYVVDAGGKAKPGNTVRCTFEGDPGQAVIPKEAMSVLPKGGGLFPDNFLVFAVSRITTSEVALSDNKGIATLGIMRTQAGVSGFN